jgi:hypothetical protein
MAYLPIVTAPCEGGLYLNGRRTDHPIRIYPDRWVEDDTAHHYGLPLRRERLDKKKFRAVKRAAKLNSQRGEV